MPLHKACADDLRLRYRHLTGRKLSAGHAHELVAAFFGYGTGSALRLESAYVLENLENADILIPDLPMMDRRVQEISALPDDLPHVDDLAFGLTDFLEKEGYFTGEVWRTRDLSEHVNSRMQSDPWAIMEDLADEIATTNASFDGPDIDEVSIDVGTDALTATISGVLDGEQDQDRVFHGDKIIFTTVMILDRVAGRVAYSAPEITTNGELDMAGYYD